VMAETAQYILLGPLQSVQANRVKGTCRYLVPNSRGLFKAVQALLEAADKVSILYKFQEPVP